MFQLINDILTVFHKCFKKTATWNWFVCVVVAFMIRNEHRGVTSVISSLGLQPRFYEQILHFFRSSAYKVEEVYSQLTQVIQDYLPFEEESGYIILAGDPIKVAKEGKRMPGLDDYHNDSENSGKPEFMEGHQFGMVCALTVEDSKTRCVPVAAKLQESKTKTGKDTLIEQMVNLGGSVLPDLQKPGLLVLDAYFCNGSTFKTADAYNDEQGRPRLAIITRAKRDTKAFERPSALAPGQKRGRGAPRKYGEGVKLYSLFDKKHAGEYTQAEVFLYGKVQKVLYLCKDLIWKPAKRVIRFVAVVTPGTKKIAALMCSDLSLSPEAIIRTYGLRFNIETNFDDLKNDLGAFYYHFWSKSLPKKRKWKDVTLPTDEKALRNIAKTRQAIEMHVCVSCIASGILTVIAFRHNRKIWNAFSGWLRTIRSSIPSIATTRAAFAQEFYAFLPSLGRLPVFKLISSRRGWANNYSDVINF